MQNVMQPQARHELTAALLVFCTAAGQTALPSDTKSMEFACPVYPLTGTIS